MRATYTSILVTPLSVLLVFRIIWGLIGPQFGRFSNFLYEKETTIKCAKSMLTFKPKRYIEHNPLGGWMITGLNNKDEPNTTIYDPDWKKAEIKKGEKKCNWMNPSTSLANHFRRAERTR